MRQVYPFLKSSGYRCGFLITLWFAVPKLVPLDNGHVLCSGSMADA
jgi:hypothetical protein